MGKCNSAVKLTWRKIKYIIRSKINNKSTKGIAAEMKVSISTVKRVWMYWLPIKKSGRKKNEVDSETRVQIIEIHKEQKFGTSRLEKVLVFKYHKHVPHNAVHEVLLEEGLQSFQDSTAVWSDILSSEFVFLEIGPHCMPYRRTRMETIYYWSYKSFVLCKNLDRHIS